MADLRCRSVLGHDGLVHALDHNGYCLCGMGRAQPVRYSPKVPPDVRDLYGNWAVDCLDCLVKQCECEREHFVTLHYGI